MNSPNQERRCRVLVIDDDVAFAELTRRRLERLGYEVSVHNTGIGVMERLLRNPFDLVLLDVNMPGLRGPEVAGMIRAARGSQLKVVFYSSTDSVELRALANKHQADGYISKSATGNELDLRLAEVMQNPLGRLRSHRPDYV